MSSSTFCMNVVVIWWDSRTFSQKVKIFRSDLIFKGEKKAKSDFHRMENILGKLKRYGGAESIIMFDISAFFFSIPFESSTFSQSIDGLFLQEKTHEKVFVTLIYPLCYFPSLWTLFRIRQLVPKNRTLEWNFHT